jgi:hypothetical protein
MIPLPLALLLLFWQGPSNFERLMQLGVLPEPIAAHRCRAADAPNAYVAIKSAQPARREPQTDFTEPRAGVSAFAEAQPALPQAPRPAQRDRDGPTA